MHPLAERRSTDIARALFLTEASLRTAALDAALLLKKEGAQPRTPLEIAAVQYALAAAPFVPPPRDNVRQLPRSRSNAYRAETVEGLLTIWRGTENVTRVLPDPRKVAEALLRDVFRANPAVDVIARDCAHNLAAEFPWLGNDHWAIEADVISAFVAQQEG